MKFFVMWDVIRPVDMLPIAKNLIKWDVTTAIKEWINLTTDLVTNPITRLWVFLWSS